ncbi:hypothetical protein [Photorhabdus sp. RM71S]
MQLHQDKEITNITDFGACRFLNAPIIKDIASAQKTTVATQAV